MAQPLLSFRLPAPLLERLEDHARTEDRTVSNIMRIAIREHLEHRDTEQKGTA